MKSILLYAAISFVLPMVMIVGVFLELSVETIIPIGIALVVCVIAFIKSVLSAKKLEGQSKISASVYCLVAIILALVIAVIKPVHDAFYYVAAILSLIAMFVTLIDLIVKYNVLATRKLPQFEYQGGDDNA